MATIKENLEHSLSKMSRGLIVRGLIAVAFGIAMVVWPSISLHTLVLLIGAFALVDGVVSLVTAFGPFSRDERGWLVFQGITGIAVGVVTYLWTDMSALAMLFVVGAWALALGTIQVVAAFRLRAERSTKILVGLYGVLAMTFGVLIFVRPGDGALALLALIAAFAIVTGSTLIALGIEVRRDSRTALSEVFPTAEIDSADRESTTKTQVS
jgi:uncharacterized membrane protein HdeD (DUF308 family)